MFYLCLLFLVLAHTLPAEGVPTDTVKMESTDANGLRMGFNKEECDLSVLFPSTFHLKCAYLENGEEIYYVIAPRGNQTITYQFADHGFELEGISAFKDKYIEGVKSAFSKNNPSGTCFTVVDEKKSENT